MQCTQCRREIDDNSKYCPFCGGKAVHETRQIEERTEGVGKNNAFQNEKSVGMISIMSYEWIINMYVIFTALIGGGIGALFDMTSDGIGLWMIGCGVIGAIVGFLCVLPMKIIAAIAHNVYISTDSILTIKRQLDEMGKKEIHTEEEIER